MGVSLELHRSGEPRPAPLILSAESPGELPEQLQAAGGMGQALHMERLTEGGGLEGCLGCGHIELYTRKDFPRGLGIGVVVVAALLAPSTHYISLGVAALLDWALFHLAPDALACYVCASLHRGFSRQPHHPRFDREIEERLRYGERAVMGRPMRAEGTADGPEPEH